MAHSKTSSPLKSTSPSSLTAHGESMSHTESASVTTPFISVEGATQPLTFSEDSHHDTPQSHQRSWGNNKDDPSSYSTPPQQLHSAKRRATEPSRRRSSALKDKKGRPNVEWNKKWDQGHDAFPKGRVMIVDCYSRDFSDDKNRKTEAHEFASGIELKNFYASSKGRRDGQCMRVVHVQDADWARDFLLEKYNISSEKEDIVGTAFGRWVKFAEPQLRAGKPVLNAQSFRTIKDPWRGVSRTGFGVDYLKSFRPGVIKESSDAAKKGFRLMALNHWDAHTGTFPVHGYDIYVQRLSVYIQRNEGSIELHPQDTELTNPYINFAYETAEQKAARKESVHLMVNDRTDADNDRVVPRRSIPKKDSWPLPEDWEKKVAEMLTELDNGSTIVVFENCHTGRQNDTLIQARDEIEVRWRRIMLYLNREEQSEEDLALECMDLVIKDIFKGLYACWERLLSKCEAHINILEDKVYENPADESRAPELWENSALWLKLEKLIKLHLVTVSDLQQQMRELSESAKHVKNDWLKDTPMDLDRIATMFEEEMVRPTANLSDLLYKSVGIRDSRRSLQLGTSMWRLSWITFIFLPLTFISGFFGMNVAIFDPPPSLRWYFIVAAPLMLFIVVAYMVLKSTLSISRDFPVQRGVYELIYNGFAAEHPHVWSRAGPRANVKPRGLLRRLKWRIVRLWFQPKNTIARKTVAEVDHLGLWPRLTRYLAQRWLADIEATHAPSRDEELGDDSGPNATTKGSLSVSMPVTMAATPATPPLIKHASRSSSASRPPTGRNGSPGSKMIVEENRSDDDSGVSGRDKNEKENLNKTQEQSTTQGADGLIEITHPLAHSTIEPIDTGLLNVPSPKSRNEDEGA